MISSLNIRDLYNESHRIVEFNSNLNIIIGKNGTGKTTILNIVFHTLNCDLDNLRKLPFKSLELNLSAPSVRKKTSKMVQKITLFKEKDSIDLSYWFTKTRKTVVSYTFNEFSYGNRYTFQHYPTKKKSDSAQLHPFDDFDVPNERDLNRLIENYNEDLSFINDIREALLYFPTYRRIDHDLPELIENSSISFGDNMKHLLDDLNFDRRVLGVNEADIIGLFENYSESLRVFSSTELNKVLKSFIETTIKSATYDKPKTSIRKEMGSKEIYESAPDNLINLSKKLEFEIDEEKIKNYYKRQLEFKNYISSNMSKNLKIGIEFKSKNSEDSSQKNQDTKKINEESIQSLFIDKLLSSSSDETVIMNLIEIYGKYVNQEEQLLQKFNLLKSILEIFFENKINLSLDKSNYNIEMNKSFSYLSTGEKQLITMFTYITLGMKKSIYQPLIIIDEPEISLHIEWQHYLLKELLKIENVNYLIATHSPYVANINFVDYIISGVPEEKYV